jgi:hypothetical protein
MQKRKIESKTKVIPKKMEISESESESESDSDSGSLISSHTSSFSDYVETDPYGSSDHDDDITLNSNDTTTCSDLSDDDSEGSLKDFIMSDDDSNISTDLDDLDDKSQDLMENDDLEIINQPICDLGKRTRKQTKKYLPIKKTEFRDLMLNDVDIKQFIKTEKKDTRQIEEDSDDSDETYEPSDYEPSDYEPSDYEPSDYDDSNNSV